MAIRIDTNQDILARMGGTHQTPLVYRPVSSTQSGLPTEAATTEEVNLTNLKFIQESYNHDDPWFQLYTFLRRHKLVSDFLPDAYQIIKPVFQNAELSLSLSKYTDTIFINIKSSLEYEKARSLFLDLRTNWYASLDRSISFNFNIKLRFV